MQNENVPKGGSCYLPLREAILERQVLMERKAVYSDAGHPEDGLMSQSPSPPLSGGRGFYKEGEGEQNKEIREGVIKFSTRQ